MLLRKPKGGGRPAPALGSEIIVQEGVLTRERVHDGVAEPVVYMMDRYVVGGFYRVHAERSIDENLDSPGASAPNRFYMYGVIGRLAMVAASYELEATDPDAEVYE